MSEWPDDWPIAAIQKIEEAEERLAEESRRHMEQIVELVNLAESRRVRLAEAEAALLRLADAASAIDVDRATKEWNVEEFDFAILQAREALRVTDSASACTCDGEYKYDGDCPIHGDPSFASDQPEAGVK